MSKPVGPICADCDNSMHILQNGVPVLLMASFGPYEIYSSDLWGCPTCGSQVLSGYSDCILKHFQDGFEDYLERLRQSGEYIHKVF